MKKTVTLFLGAFVIILSIAGLIDSLYLTWSHYNNIIPPCESSSLFVDCGKVLTSRYSIVFGVPLALIGAIFYALEIVTLTIAFLMKKHPARIMAIILTAGGFGASLYFVYLMVFVIGALCKYCLVSAILSTCIFFMAQFVYPNDRRWLIARVMECCYVYALKPIFFRIDPEKAHVSLVSVGRTMGDIGIAKSVSSFLLATLDERLTQHINGITFGNPIGLAAGFDYEANLTQILGSIGFGFQSVGTITNSSYEGNPRPMLGRLPLSKSLMVNKGFKNLGADATINKLKKLSFPIPVGISIGRTNRINLKTQTQSIDDIVTAFIKFEKSRVPNSYYELNISCPNLKGNISFYPPKNLNELLSAVDSLKIKKPIFIKMPIEESKKDTLAMLDIIAKHSPAGVIFGNLAISRDNPVIHPSEQNKYNVGKFSGKPTFANSNERISLTYKHFKDRFVIIGCGGVFNAEDAYEKITRGATLVQMITGMIYQGPQVISSINNGLLDMLDRDGFTHLKDAIGTK